MSLARRNDLCPLGILNDLLRRNCLLYGNLLSRLYIHAVTVRNGPCIIHLLCYGLLIRN